MVSVHVPSAVNHGPVERQEERAPMPIMNMDVYIVISQSGVTYLAIENTRLQAQYWRPFFVSPSGKGIELGAG